MLGVLIPSLTTTSPLPAISDKTSTSGFLVALNELLGGDSNESNSKQMQKREKSPADAARRIWIFLGCDNNNNDCDSNQNNYNNKNYNNNNHDDNDETNNNTSSTTISDNNCSNNSIFFLDSDSNGYNNGNNIYGDSNNNNNKNIIIFTVVIIMDSDNVSKANNNNNNSSNNNINSNNNKNDNNNSKDSNSDHSNDNANLLFIFPFCRVSVACVFVKLIQVVLIYRLVRLSFFSSNRTWLFFPSISFLSHAGKKNSYGETPYY